MEAAALQRALGLTPRESDVLFWIAQGKSNRDASEIMNISARTVNKHLEQIFVKLGVENRASAAAIAARSEEHTSELQSLMRISYAVFCLKKKKTNTTNEK